jgi:hypothetical protein
MIEEIEWMSVENELPYDNRDVFIFRIGAVSIGYYDRDYETWRTADRGTAIDFVEYFAEFPKGPTEEC